MPQEYIFLSPEWVHEVTKTIQGARAQDENFKKLTTGYTLNLAYVLSDLPVKLNEQYKGKKQVVVFVQLDKGTVRKLLIDTELPEGKIDFTVSSSYNVAKQIFLGELNAATAFINRVFSVEPMSQVYRRPRFAAKSVILGNMMLKLARQVQTRFEADNIM